jgi:hypothetical protein
MAIGRLQYKVLYDIIDNALPEIERIDIAETGNKKSLLNISGRG